MSFWSWLAHLFSGNGAIVPPPFVPQPTPLKPIGLVVFGTGHLPIAGASARLDGAGTFPLTNGDGYALANVPKSLGASQLYIVANGYVDYSVHVDLPTHGGDLLVGGVLPGLNQQVLTPLVPKVAPHKAAAFTKAQLTDLQGDLMIWCPELAPIFENGIDPETGIHAVADNGQVPHGIVAGWIWTLWIPYYSQPHRFLIYDKIKSFGYTHVAIQVCQPMPDGGYHGLRPMTQGDCDNWGPLMNTIHQELLDHDLIPICAGVSPVGTPGGAALAPGFDTTKVLIAMSDWDNTDTADGRIKALAEAFPNALLYYELPESAIFPKPDAATQFVPTATNGGAWIRNVQSRYPNFIGVMYEINQPLGLDQNTQELAQCHAWWRDIQEVQFEIDTYQKFWENYDVNDSIKYNDALFARNPQLVGYMSGRTAHAAPSNVVANTTTSASVGDMLPISTITFVGGPNLQTFPQTATITRLELRTTGVHVEFTKQTGPNAWPSTPNHEATGGMGPLQYSLGLVLKVNGVWYGSAPIELWAGVDESGGSIQSQHLAATGKGQISSNWFYDSRWGALAGYQPQPGETIGFFVVAGDARNSIFAVQERSNIVTFPLPADGVPQTFTWSV